MHCDHIAVGLAAASSAAAAFVMQQRAAVMQLCGEYRPVVKVFLVTPAYG